MVSFLMIISLRKKRKVYVMMNKTRMFYGFGEMKKVQLFNVERWVSGIFLVGLRHFLGWLVGFFKILMWTLTLAMYVDFQTQDFIFGHTLMLQ